MKYFSSVVDFVDANLIWVFVAFLAATLIEFLIFLIRKKKRQENFSTDGYFVAVVSNILILLGLYILACLGVGLVNYLKVQDYHFYTNYVNFVTGKVAGPTSIIVFVGVFIAATIFYLIKFDIDSIIFRVICSVLVAVLTTGAAVIVGFLVYVVVAVVIIILKMVWFVISGVFISIFWFFVKYWKWVLLVLFTPGVIYGAVRSFINYVVSLKKEVFE
ncbi:MAG: hypothetical protein E7680_05505 [Ruminococcaceae bacterium]|nr:hypothetical protein [Oscillospiraceae bacterium]